MSANSYYTPAAVCRRGHIQTLDTTYSEVSERCAQCGAKVLKACPSCEQRIRGELIVPGVISFGSGPRAIAPFCDRCGAALPWADRQARIHELENLLDEEDLDSATELTVREQLAALASPDIDEEEQISRWARIRSAAPSLFEKIVTHPVFVSVVTGEAKQQLGLPPGSPPSPPAV